MSNEIIFKSKDWKLIFIILIFFINCIPYIQKKRLRNFVRVAIVCGVDYVEITGRKENKLYNDYSISSSGRFPLYFNSYKGSVVVNNKQYRGDLEIQKIEQKIWVINVLDIEDYLKGVVPCEIGRTTMNLIEAAKAQAVAARTYAYAHFDQYEQLGFDLYATIQDQVYRGVAVEHPVTSQAIEQTQREILTFGNMPLVARYHSTCGGRTADFNDAWTGKPPPYLRSVKCPYCKDSPYYTWRKVWHKKEFFRNLQIRLAEIGITFSEGELIKTFKIKRNKKSKRINKIKIVTTKDEYAIKSYNIRKLFGDEKDPGGLLKSTYFALHPEDDSIKITGSGYGHGVGMCQFGAIEMARKGKSYKEILYHYYTGVKIIRISPKF